MLTKGRRIAARCIALVCVLVAAAAFAGDQASTAAGTVPEFREGALAHDPRSVFFIQRNKNRNEVHYAIELDRDCRPVGDQPVTNYWLRLEEGPDVTRPLTFFQQRGYGFKSQQATADGARIVLRSLADRPIDVVAARSPSGSACAAEAYLDIGGRRAQLERVYVSAEDGMFMPEVKYIELFARRSDGAPVTERLEPK
jgi:hypothetical protein